MDQLWRPVALGKLSEFLKRINKKTSRKDILSAVEGLLMPQDLKKHLLNQLVSRGIIFAPAFTAWAQFSPEKAILWTIEEIRSYSGEEV
jgi:hypothetical protein